MTQLKVVNNLSAVDLNEVLERLESGEVQVIMEPGRDEDQCYLVEPDDFIGTVQKLANHNVHFAVTIELEEHHRYVEGSIFEFIRISGKLYLVQREPWVNPKHI